MRLAAALLVLAASCGGSADSGTSITAPGGAGGAGGARLAGSYALTSVDGKRLPAAVADSTYLSGLLTVSDSTWQQVMVVRYAQGGSQTTAGDSLTSAGRYVVSGSTVTFADAGGTIYQGTYTSTVFTLSSKGNTFVFTK